MIENLTRIYTKGIINFIFNTSHSKVDILFSVWIVSCFPPIFMYTLFRAMQCISLKPFPLTFTFVM